MIPLPDRLTVHHTPGHGPHHARSPYVERYWLPTLGPTCVALLRRLALDAETTGQGWTEYQTADLAESLGLGARGNTLHHALRRLAGFGFAADEGPDVPGVWSVATGLPAVNPKHLTRLPRSLQAELAELTH